MRSPTVSQLVAAANDAQSIAPWLDDQGVARRQGAKDRVFVRSYVHTRGGRLSLSACGALQQRIGPPGSESEEGTYEHRHGRRRPEDRRHRE